MPELPDVVVYREALETHVRGHVLRRGSDGLMAVTVGNQRAEGKQLLVATW